MLQQATALSRLSLTGVNVTDTQPTKSGRSKERVIVATEDQAAQAVLELLSKLPSLAELDLVCQSSLDQLGGIGLALGGVLGGMQHLRRISLGRISLQPSILSRFPQLQHLALHEVYILMHGSSNGASQASVLLPAVGKLDKLRHLALSGMQLGGCAHQPQQYTALTASSHLTELSIINDSSAWGPPAIPKEALRHMLPAGKQLSHLRVLQLDPSKGPPMSAKYATACFESAGSSAALH